MKEQGLFHTADSVEPQFTDHLELDLAQVRPSIAGPRRPQDRLPLAMAKEKFREALPGLLPPAQQNVAAAAASGRIDEQPFQLAHGSVVIAAITSCTNTSNPAVMLAAGLLAKKAVERGLSRPAWVKTSLAPGSRVVMDYYQRAGITPYLEALGFHLVGYGCTTCIGNSGPLPEEISAAIAGQGLVVASVLSGNRNFEGRINPEVRANYLMSPPLVVAFALAGRIDIDLENEPLGTDAEGHPVYLRELWPSSEDINRLMGEAIESAMYHRTYETIFQGEERWNGLPIQESEHYPWQESSTYVRLPPYFERMPRHQPELQEIRGARVLAMFGDSVTTDHISPAGNIKADSPAGRYLLSLGVEAKDFNSYGARRGNHEVMVRGTFANVRIRNLLVPGVEGGFTRYLPGNEILPIYDAAMRYRQNGTTLLVLAGKEYGSGSSRDWAAKGPYMQGVRLVIAESYERIPRSNLIGMGILPLQFSSGDSIACLRLTGEELFEVGNLAAALADGGKQRQKVQVRVTRQNGESFEFSTLLRIDTPQEVLYYRHGGILHYVLRQLLNGKEGTKKVAGGMAASPQASPEHTPGGVEADNGSIGSFPASDPPAY
jgi:aconitate hydratase